MQGNISEWIRDLYDTETYEYDFKESWNAAGGDLQIDSQKDLYLPERLATRTENSLRTMGPL